MNSSATHDTGSTKSIKPSSALKGYQLPYHHQFNSESQLKHETLDSTSFLDIINNIITKSIM